MFAALGDELWKVVLSAASQQNHLLWYGHALAPAAYFRRQDSSHLFLSAACDLAFIMIYAIALARQRLWCSSFAIKDYAGKMNGLQGCIPQKVHLGIMFTAAFFCCTFLLWVNAIVVLRFLFDRVPLPVIAAAVIHAAAWFIVVIATFKSRKRVKFFMILRTWWAVSSLLSLYSLLLNVGALLKGSRYSSLNLWVSVSSFPAALFLGVVAIQGKTVYHYKPPDLREPLLVEYSIETYDCNEITPYSTAGFFSLLTFSWLNPLLSVGARKILDLKDIPLLTPKDRAEISYSVLQASWDKLNARKTGNPPSLTLAIIMSFWREAAWNSMFVAGNTLAKYVGPYLLKDFVAYLGGRRRFLYEGYVMAFLFIGSKIFENVTERQWKLGIGLLDIHFRAALTAFVYQKGLRLSSQSRQNHTNGEIINYMGVDVQRIGEYLTSLHEVWVLPLNILLALPILYSNVGLASVATLAVIFVFIICVSPLTKLQKTYQDQLMAAKDVRMRATSECLRNMRILKMQACENWHCKKLENLRMKEYSWLCKVLYTRAAMLFAFAVSPVFLAVVTFGMCIPLGIPLTAGTVLSAIATFRVLQQPLRSFPYLLYVIVQIKVSLERLSSFLQEEELQVDGKINEVKDPLNLAIEIKQADFSWDASFETPTLSRINIDITKGMRVAVCGIVGSGKSNLLSCILGAIPKITGTVKVCGTMAYVPQSAWIQTGSIEDNVTFGSPMEKTWYKNALQVCALEKDLSLLSDGDQTVIGERGTNLSGGQKQRVQLARALYQDADIYLLDDLFSTLDVHTGTELFKDYILGALAHKTVVFVTHQVDFLPAADLILVLQNGEIVQSGKYEELLQAGTDFSSLVCAHDKSIKEMDAADYLVDRADGSDRLTQNGRMVVNEERYTKSYEIEKLPTTRDRQLPLHQDTSSISPMSKENNMSDNRRTRQFVKEEERERGSVALRVYKNYLTAVYGGSLIPVIIFAQISFQLLQISSNWWMALGSPKAQGKASQTGSIKLILVFMGLSFASSFCSLLRVVCVAIFGLKASQKLFLNMQYCIFRAPMSFFDSTPTSRILNRVSMDQTVVDFDISFKFSASCSTAIQLLAIIGVVSQAAWEVLLLFFPVTAICLWMQRYYLASAREFMRLAAVQKSPIIHHFSESIAGATTIRCFGQEERFKRKNFYLFDSFARPYFSKIAATEWFCLRLEFLATLIFAFLVVFLTSIPPGTIQPSMAGLAVTYALNLNERLSKWVLSLSNLETKMVSVERILQYTHIPSEAPCIMENSHSPSNWPMHGTIELHELKVKYAENLPVVLHSITCTFPGGNKIGLVGRTGCGKSTLVQALFRIMEPVGGKIIIDGIDITTIGLHDLRSKLQIISQDPILFEGTLRQNLDPFEQHSDFEIWEALDKCRLGDVIRAKQEKLEALATENGGNWSVGQRQLLCLGQALLRHTQILVLDEATTSMDSATDNAIQQIIRANFGNCTVITIAHRIPTVIDSDLVLVLSDGRVAEFDVPIKLMEDKSSLFFKLVLEYHMRLSSISNLANAG